MAPPVSMTVPDPLQVAFFGGVTATGCAIAGFFFLRFWRRTGERLFAAFALAFWLMAINQVQPMFLHTQPSGQPEPYLPRLAAFLVIIAAILAKNLRR